MFINTSASKRGSAERLGLCLVPFVVACGQAQDSSGASDASAEQQNHDAQSQGGTSGTTHGGGASNDHGGSSNHGGGTTNSGGTGGTTSGGGTTSNGGGGGAETSTGGAETGGAACVPNPVCSPTAAPSSGDDYADCVARINQFRTQCLCLPPLARWTAEENCADQDAEYDSTRTPHSGFIDNICQPEAFAQNECPGWDSNRQTIVQCLQQMWNEGPPPTATCEGQCYQDHGHFINMTNPDYSQVACGFFTTPDGKIWAVQNFK